MMKIHHFFSHNRHPLLLQATTQSVAKRPVTGIDFGGLIGEFMNPEGLSMLGILLSLAVFSKIVGSGKGKVT
jgi:hypothetical protein